MTFGQLVLFHGSCGVVQASCLLIGVELAQEGRVAWALLAGLVGLAAAHVEHVVSNWA